MLLNDLTFAGFAGRDAEDFTSQGGTRVVTLSLAHTEKARGNQVQDTVTWVKVKVFGQWTESAAKIKKGDNVMIKGKLQENKWKDKQTGADRTSLEVVAFSLGVIARDTQTHPGSPGLPKPVGGSSSYGETPLEDLPF